ncbi:MAG: twin-arginine translocation signal domain-containing protein [Deltaproteobacteria bacterium]|nr:twin-arginine translocation signal domain-containing protein [Deltaproteobacteria bacterium]
MRTTKRVFSERPLETGKKHAKGLNRRDFLKYSGVTGAAVSAAVLGGFGSTARAAGPPIAEKLGSVSGANIIVYDPGAADAFRSRICILNMYGSSRSTDILPNAGIKRFAALGYRSANCAPTNGYFIDQVQYLSNCIKWIKANISGVEKIVLWGNSRGCNLQSAYQRIAENGPATFQGPHMFLPIPNMTLTPADGIIYCDPNHGFMVNVLASLATNLVDDDSVMKRTKRLDPLTAENGYLGNGVASYTDRFCREIWRAQAERYNRLLDKARERMHRIKAGKGMFSDDEPFCVVMGFGNVNAYQLYAHDIRFYSRTKGACKLLHNDGTITTQIVPSLRNADKDPGNFEDMSKCYNTKVSEFLYLGMHVDEHRFGYNETECFGVRWEDNFSSPNGNSRYIHCPTLAVGRTAGFEFEVAEWIYNDSVAEKKDMIFIEGMTHGGGTTPGFPNVVTLENNYIDNWLHEVFA